jgi:hypothetical protein
MSGWKKMERNLPETHRWWFEVPHHISMEKVACSWLTALRPLQMNDNLWIQLNSAFVAAHV